MRTIGIRNLEFNFSNEEMEELIEKFRKALEEKPEKIREHYLSDDIYGHHFDGFWSIADGGGDSAWKYVNAKTRKELIAFKIHLIFQKLVDGIHKEEFGIDRYYRIRGKENWSVFMEDGNLKIGWSACFQRPMTIYSKTEQIMEKALSMLTEEEKDIYFNRKK